MTVQPTNVLITVELEGLAEAARAVQGSVVSTAYQRPQIMEALRSAEVLCVEHLDAEMLAAAPRLRWIHSMRAGSEYVLFPEMVAHPAPLTCVKQAFGFPGAQHAMGAMLGVVTRINEYFWLRTRRKLVWDLPRELAGKTLGIIGFGNIGQKLAELARPFGMHIIALARNPRPDPAPADRLLEPHHLPLLLAESDFVVNAVPLTSRTRGLIDAPQLRQMKPTAWLIDISGRAAIINQDAVIAALNNGVIAGADLQFAAAPPADSPLWTMQNLIISQYSANSQEESLRSIEIFTDNLRRFTTGRPLRGLVDKTAGY